MDYKEIPIKFKSLVHFQLSRGYDEFKRQYPDEEPFVRVLCTRRYHSSDSLDWRSCKKSSEINEWRATSIDEKGVSTDLETKKGVFENKEVMTKKRSQHKILKRGTDVNERVIKKIEIKEEYTDETVKMVYNPVTYAEVIIDGTMRPYNNNILLYDEIGGTTRPMKIESVEDIKQSLCFVSKNLFSASPDVISDELSQTIEDRKKSLNKIKELERELEELYKKVPEYDSIIFKQVKNLFPKTIKTMDDVCENYIKNQTKLNDLQSYVLPLFRTKKCLDMDWKEWREKYGFILALKKAIKWLYDGMNFDHGEEFLTDED
jgi:hypothetical protein